MSFNGPGIPIGHPCVCPNNNFWTNWRMIDIWQHAGSS